MPHSRPSRPRRTQTLASVAVPVLAAMIVAGAASADHRCASAERTEGDARVVARACAPSLHEAPQIEAGFRGTSIVLGVTTPVSSTWAGFSTGEQWLGPEEARQTIWYEHVSASNALQVPGAGDASAGARGGFVQVDWKDGELRTSGLYGEAWAGTPGARTSAHASATEHRSGSACRHAAQAWVRVGTTTRGVAVPDQPCVVTLPRMPSHPTVP